MKTRISAIVCLLCVIGYSDLSRAEDPSSQGGADPYAIPSDPLTMSSGTIEPYFSFMAGWAFPSSEDATFQDGTKPTVIKGVDYQMGHSWGGNAGIWFPTRDKLAGFDLGVEITGYVSYPKVGCCRDFFNNDPTGNFQTNDVDPVTPGVQNHIANRGTTTEVSSVYVGPNFLVRYPMDISGDYPNGRWHPYVGGGVGAHQMAMSPGGFRGGSLFHSDTKQRDTTIGFQGVAGIKAHLFKYVAAFAEAKYLYAHHNGLKTDRFGNSPGGSIAEEFLGQGLPGPFMNPYSSRISTVLVHAGVSFHFNWEPPDWGE
jgi:opacity protein-like surface antigen